MGGAAGRTESWVTAGSETHEDMILSDDSLEVMSPPTATRRKANSRDHAGRVAAKTPKTSMTMRSFSTGAKRRGGHRPPSPSVERLPLPDHVLVKPQDNTSEARILALEQQQQADHTVLSKVIASVRDLQSTVERQKAHNLQEERNRNDYIGLGMKLRQEIYAIRDNLGDSIKQVTAQAIPDGVAQLMQQGAGQVIGNAVERKFAELETLLGQLQGHVAHLAGREGQVEQYLNAQGDRKTLEEHAVEGAFESVNSRISQVGEMVKKFEASNTSGVPSSVSVHAIPFTTAMRDSMADIHTKVQTLETINAGCNALWEKASCHAAAIEGINGATVSQHARIEGLERILAEHAASLAATAMQPQLNLSRSFRAGVAAAAPEGCQDGGCIDPGCGAPPPPPNPWAPAETGIGASGSSSAGDPVGLLRAVIGGNNRCHCIHVSELIEKVTALEQRANTRHGAAPSDTPPPDFWAAAAGRLAPPAASAARAGPTPLPLALHAPLGAIAFKDRKLFDDKLAMQDEFKFNGVRGGISWKGKVERYFISCAPILKELLEWAEKEDMDEITEEKFRQAVGGRLTHEQVAMTNAGIWGFLSNGISGSAEATFKRAPSLNGLDAWRRMARFIDHGRGIRLETLRREVKMLHMRPIKNLEGVEQGITEFENTLIEYAQAGGTVMSEDEMKSDLLAILPLEIRETLMWKAQEEGPFQKFRDHVILQTSKILMNRQRLPLHAVTDEPEQYADEISDLAGIIAGATSMEELVAAVQSRFKNKNMRGNQRRQQPPPARLPTRQPRKDDAPRPPRKCPNCGGTHEARVCHKPPVDVKSRPCWNCGEPGHVSSKCPAKTLRAIEDVTVAHVSSDLLAQFMVDDEGFQEVRRHGSKGASRPMPIGATLGDFFTKNAFDALAQPSERVPSARQALPVNGEHAGSVGKPGTATGTEDKFCRSCERISVGSHPQECPRCGVRGAMSDVDDESRSRDGATPDYTRTHVLVRPPTAGRIGILLPKPLAADGARTNPVDGKQDVGRQVSPHMIFGEGNSQVAGHVGHLEKMRKTTNQNDIFLGPMADSVMESAGRVGGSSVSSGPRTDPPPVNGEHAGRVGGVGRDAPKPEAPEPHLNMKEIVKSAVEAAQELMRKEAISKGSINALYDPEEPLLAAAVEKVTVRPVMDSGSVDNVIHPRELPCDADPTPNSTGSHFVGANNSKIEKFGTCDTRLESDRGQVGCQWQLADVTRPLHSVSRVAGPKGGPGKQDVLFNNDLAVVVPPGVVNEILKRIKPVAVYEREGNLYVGKFEMSAFGRQSQEP